jgi:hypothetical protein
MHDKQRPRLEKFFSRIKSMLVSEPSRRVSVRPVVVKNTRHVQLELDLGLKRRE